MPAPEQLILLVADPDDTTELREILASAGHSEVMASDGSDETLAIYEQSRPDVVILCARLAHGDAQALASAMRDAPHGSAVQLVLIGDRQGPIRNALDASDFAVDRFLAQPLSPKALIFAVQNCLRAAAAARSGARPAPSHDQLEHKVELAMNQAIDDVVRDAMQALPKARRSRATLVGMPPPPVSGKSGPHPVAELPPEDSAPRASTGSGAFARELRRKMTVMAERLFPGQRASAQVDVGPSRDHSAEIDLAQLSLDTQMEAGDATAGADGDEDHFQNLMPTTPFLRPEDAEPAGELSREPSSDGEPPAAVATDDDAVTLPRIPAAEAEEAPAAELEWVEQELPDTGEICRGRSDAGILIEQMYRRRFTGRVSFCQGEAEKEILFDGGRPIFASSSLLHDRMGELLFREGKINAEQYQQVKAIMAASGRRIGEVLIELGWLKRRELLPMVRRHIEDIVYSLFAWESGTYRVTAGDFAAGERIRISRHPAAMLLEGVRRKLDLESLMALVGKPDSIIEITDDRRLKSVMSVADLSVAERKVIAGFDKERTIAEVQQDASLELVEVYQLAYGLIVWGAARLHRRGDDGIPAAIADEAAVTGEVAASETDELASETDELAIDRQRVMAKYSLVAEADYFTLLGVRRDATSFEIRRAYEAARRDYALEGFAPELGRELGRELAEINELLDEAYRVLRDDGLRASYLAHLCD